MTRRLKGGWFCGPEEYESMGFTLGLPPGLYFQETQESSELVEKIKPLNGMIMPSFYMNPNFGHTENGNLILISNIPIDVTTEEVISELNKRLVEAHIILSAQEESAPSFIISCQIIRSHFIAYVKLISAYVTEKAVGLKNIVIKGNILPISFPDFILKDPPPLDKIYAAVKESQLCIVLEIDYEAEGYNKSIIYQLPTEEAISEYFSKYVTVNRIYRPTESRHAFLYLNSLKDVDFVLLNHHNCVIDNKPIVIHRSSREPNENEYYSDPLMKAKIQRESGASQYFSVLSPFMNQKNSVPSIADIFDMSMTINSIIRRETEELQETSGQHLLLFNIIQESFLNNQIFVQEISDNITNECNNYGEVKEVTIGLLFKNQLPIDSPVACVSFKTPQCAKAAQIGVSGRRFRGRIVITQIVDQVPEFLEIKSS